jgi:hypothetical protein
MFSFFLSDRLCMILPIRRILSNVLVFLKFFVYSLLTAEHQAETAHGYLIYTLAFPIKVASNIAHAFYNLTFRFSPMAVSPPPH